MAAETKTDATGIITYDVPQEAEVALTGGEILLDLPGENDFRLKVRVFARLICMLGHDTRCLLAQKKKRCLLASPRAR